MKEYERVMENLHIVRDEVHDILDNVEAVKGKKYRELLMLLLLSGNLSEVAAAIEHCSDDGEDVREKLRDVFTTCLHRLIVQAFRASGADEVCIPDLLVDAERIRDSYNNLASRAINSGMNNVSFRG